MLSGKPCTTTLTSLPTRVATHNATLLTPLCRHTGKVYYDALKAVSSKGGQVAAGSVAAIRLEEIAPFPTAALRKLTQER